MAALELVKREAFQASLVWGLQCFGPDPTTFPVNSPKLSFYFAHIDGVPKGVQGVGDWVENLNTLHRGSWRSIRKDRVVAESSNRVEQAEEQFRFLISSSLGNSRWNVRRVLCDGILKCVWDIHPL